jgi:glycosyltransferase involved in cell wall biosynthesis
MKTLHLPRLDGDLHGWGIFCKNMRKELAAHFELTDDRYADVVLMPLANHEFEHSTVARGMINLAMTFFEFELQPMAPVNAKRYDVVFAGSTWCLNRMHERGITNGKLLIQGVDQSIFKPGVKPAKGEFRIFSGGKFEWRKGQDLVIAAFKQLMRIFPESHLVCAWHNPWFKQLAPGMGNSPHIKFEASGNTQQEFYASLLMNNGIPPHRFTILPPLSQPMLADVMSRCHAGVFPNRCEGGTNLVLMEFLSCGRPAAANLLTGHADLIGADIERIYAVEDVMHWADQTVADIVDAVSGLYGQREQGPIQQWTWADAAKKVADTIASL